MNQRHIIFDFDGTIANSTDISYKIYQALSDHYGFEKFTTEEINELRTLSLHERLKKHHISIFQIPRLARKTKNIIRDLMHEVYPYEGIRDLLIALKNQGYVLSIVSSNRKENIEAFLTMHTISVFDQILGNASFFGKERMMKRAMRKYKDHDSIYIGDEIRDVVSAKSIGLRVIAVTWGYDDFSLIEDMNPDEIIHDVHALKDYLQNDWSKEDSDD